MEEVYEGIYRIKIPLINSPLKELNCYMIRGEQRNLIIDTGFNQPEGRAVLLGAVKELGFGLDNTDIFITHLHSDHSGLLCALKTPNNRAYASAVDAAYANGLLTDAYWQEVAQRNLLIGFPPEDTLDLTTHPAYTYRMDAPVDFTIIKEGDSLDLGKYVFTIIDMAGHTPGQLGLYEKTHKICFCADHILAKITPNIIAWDLEHDHLGIFLKNLRGVRAMEIAHLYGGHRTFIPDHRVRIDELLAHHRHRLAEALRALESGPKNAYQTASLMRWEFGGGDFKGFPPQQKWFAASETLAHLQHLLFEGKVQRIQEGEVLMYSPA